MSDTLQPDLTVSDAREHETTPVYRLEGVTRVYTGKGRSVTALDAVDLTIAAGEFATVQGPTGGGKSTLLQILGALDSPTSGRVLLGEADLARESRAALARIRAQDIGFVFQAFNLIPTLTAAENVDVGLEPLGLARAEREERVRAALAQVDLAERADHRPGELSGGQQQRVAIARALVKKPRVLLADEPTGNLDERTRDEILQLMEGLCAEGLTMVVVTHDSAVARRAHRRLRLERGVVREQRG
ncbi:ABC transporter ATP-binding protein [Microbacterium aurantiacum]|uniref:ABC transporter ATP-binding protein n=1 Tax=Microbacterium aurantiacum TaxID=162393 RepID=A0AAJ2HJ55_9MICO|nr:ABC transporter ATP-binding protein [Microbacterium aurantiacum]MDS0246592.1 ABC transporter ATP-binding protein [Microbacterium aurantiacum]